MVQIYILHMNMWDMCIASYSHDHISGFPINFVVCKLASYSYTLKLDCILAIAT